MNSSFVRGIVMGMLVGAALGMIMAPKKKNRICLRKTLKSAGEIVGGITDAIIG